MINKIITFSLTGINGQSIQPPPPTAAASPNPTPPNYIPSIDPTVVALVCTFLFVGFFSVYHSLKVHGGRSSTGGVSHSTGIDPKLLNTFPILPCSDVIMTSPAECAVCLAEFDHRDMLRLLPTCNHVFHPQCIDAWLTSHVTCPVCRTWLKPAARRRRNDVVIVIPNDEVIMNEGRENRVEPHYCEERTSLVRCHSTGHSVGIMKDEIMVSHGGMRRSVSYNGFR